MPDLPNRVRSGGCQCGALRYALMSEPTHTSIENRPHFADRITQGEGITSAQSTAWAPGNYATRQHPDHDTDEWPPTSVGNAPSNLVRR